MEIKTLGVLLGLFHIICAVPEYTVNAPQPNKLQESYMQEEGEPSENFKKEVKEYLDENEEKVEVEGDNESYIQEEEEGEGEPSETSEKEVQKALNGPQTTFREEQAEVEGGGAIRQGDTVVLQTHIKERWLSCWTGRCNTVDCPGAIFTRSDLQRCRGEVFRIFKPHPGEIRSGDIVGLHYTDYRHRNDLWLGCAPGNCGVSNCPGRPCMHYGFNSKKKWFKCHGEVYVIYAYRKGHGAVINSGDDIMLYTLYKKGWVNGDGRVEGNNHCPGRRPPQEHKFDVCSHEVFTIMKP